MNLSPRKKFGSTHVGGSRILRVTKEHSVSTIGAHGMAHTGLAGGSHAPVIDRFEGRKWVFCKEGDLVIEVVRAKKRKFVGYSYLTGPAIQIMGYKEKPDCFAAEPLKVGEITIPGKPQSEEDAEEFLKIVEKRIDEAKQENDICVCATNAVDREDANIAVGFLSKFWDDSEGTAHLFAEILYDKNQGMQLHIQPEEHVSELFANHFQFELLFNMMLTKKAAKAMEKR